MSASFAFGKLSRIKATESNHWMGMQRKSSRKGELKWRQTDWYWYDGTSLDFVNWGELQPNSDSNSCAVVMKITGLWDDRDCTGLYRFICKTGA